MFRSDKVLISYCSYVYTSRYKVRQQLFQTNSPAQAASASSAWHCTAHLKEQIHHESLSRAHSSMHVYPKRSLHHGGLGFAGVASQPVQDRRPHAEVLLAKSDLRLVACQGGMQLCGAGPQQRDAGRKHGRRVPLMMMVVTLQVERALQTYSQTPVCYDVL